MDLIKGKCNYFIQDIFSGTGYSLGENKAALNFPQYTSLTPGYEKGGVAVLTVENVKEMIKYMSEFRYLPQV